MANTVILVFSRKPHEDTMDVSFVQCWKAWGSICTLSESWELSHVVTCIIILAPESSHL